MTAGSAAATTIDRSPGADENTGAGVCVDVVERRTSCWHRARVRNRCAETRAVIGCRCRWEIRYAVRAIVIRATAGITT
jgi:hypothetical protein